MAEAGRCLPAWEQEFHDIVSLLQRFSFLPQESWTCFFPLNEVVVLGSDVDGKRLVELRLRAEWCKDEIVFELALRRWSESEALSEERNMPDRLRANWQPASLRIFGTSSRSGSFPKLWLIDSDLQYVLEALRRTARS